MAVPPAWSRAFLGALAVAGAAACAWIAWPFLGAILSAGMLGIALGPLQAWILKGVRHRGSAALLTLAVFVIAAVLPAVLVSLAVVRELRQAVAAWPGLDHLPWLDALAARAGLTGEELRTLAEDQFRQSLRGLLGTAAGLVSGIGSGVLSAVVTLFTLFFVLRDGEDWRRRAVVWLPLEPERTLRLAEVARQTIIANVYGVLAVALAQGSIAGTGFWLAGVPSPLLWGVVTGVFSLIPLVGSGLVWGPAVIWLFASGHAGAGIFLLVWSASLVAYADNVVRPYVISEQMKINPLFIFFALLGGAQVFGFAGLFLGPVIVALTGAAVRLLVEDITRASAARA